MKYSNKYDYPVSLYDRAIIDLNTPCGPAPAFSWHRVPRILSPLCFFIGGILWAFGCSVRISVPGLELGIDYIGSICHLFEMPDGSWYFKLGA